MKAIKGTWNTLKNTFRIMNRYSRDSFYALLSYLVMLVVTFGLIIPLFETALKPAQKDGLGWLFFCFTVYVAYGILYFVTASCNVALVTGIAARLDGDDPGLAVGIGRAAQRTGLIAIYTLVSATLGLVSVLARMLTNPFLGGVITPLVGDKLWTRWRQLSYNIPLQLAIPVIALDQPAPENIFERSELLVKATWGERVKPAHSLGLLALLGLLPILVLFAMPTLRQGLVERNPDQIRLGLSVMLIAISTYTQVNAWANAIFALAAYRYATTRQNDLWPEDASYAEHAFVKPKQAIDEAAPLAVAMSDAPSGSVNDSLN